MLTDFLCVSLRLQSVALIVMELVPCIHLIPLEVMRENHVEQQVLHNRWFSLSSMRWSVFYTLLKRYCQLYHMLTL